MPLVVLQPFASFFSKKIPSLKGCKRLHPLTYCFCGLIIEQPIKHVAVALAGTPAVTEPLSDILPKCNGRVWHKLKMHYAFFLSRVLV